jgi:tetratricopeptide (TPR) repeat protein
MNEIQSEKIDRYLLNSMTDSERQNFEQEMATNEDLAMAVAIQKLEHRSFQLALRDDLKVEMNNWKAARIEAETKAHQQTLSRDGDAKIIPLQRRILQWAAAAVILLAVGFVGNRLFFPTPSGVDLAAELYGSPSFTTKGESQTTFDQCLSLIENGNYKTALEKLNTVDAPDLIVPKLFAIGHCHYKLKDYAAAATTFDTILSQTNDPLSMQRAEWHGLLMHLALGKKDAAFENRLAKIKADANHLYHSKAMRIIK